MDAAWRDRSAFEAADVVLVRERDVWTVLKDREGDLPRETSPALLALRVLGFSMTDEFERAVDAAHRTGGGAAVIGLVAGWMRSKEEALAAEAPPP